jgi:hypothetical protein
MQNPKIYKIHTKACSPLGKFFRVTQSEKNLGNVDWSAKKFAAKKLDQFLLFYCSRKQIRLVENGLTVDFTKLWPRQLRDWLGIWEL